MPGFFENVHLCDPPSSVGMGEQAGLAGLALSGLRPALALPGRGRAVPGLQLDPRHRASLRVT